MKQAMIFAAGLGTRLRPLTDTMPKALVAVGGKPLLWHVMMKLKAEGFERVVVNVHHFASQIVEYIEANQGFGLDVRISDESAQLLDTGGALKKAQPLFDESEPILVHNVDILSDTPLGTVVEAARTEQGAALTVSRRETSRYLLSRADRRLVGWTNVATGQVKSPFPDFSTEGCERWAFSGIHAFHPSLFPLMDAWPDRFSVIDFYLAACKDHPVSLLPVGTRLLDVGKLDTLDQAEKFIKEI